MLSVCLRVAVHCCEVDFVRFLYVSVSMLYKHAFATTLRANKQEILIVGDPLLESFKVALSHYCAQESSIVR